MHIDRRAFLAASAAAALSAELSAQTGPVLRPEDFGARGDGATNDSDAFTALSRRIAAMGGGTIALTAGRTYLVGRQRRAPDRAFAPQPLIELTGITRPLTIVGNGARLRAAPGLRFGAFDAARDRPVHRTMPNFRVTDIASPYSGMIVVRGARAPVTIRDIELDGNLPRLRIGGRYGDTGWQIAGSGLFLVDNLAEEIISNVYSHHHGQDGAMIDGLSRRSARSRITRLVCRSNGRQGMSIVGGNGYDFADCEFSRTGRSVISSAPGAGVDIEAEGGKIIRDLSFTRCKFLDNAGPGLIADTGDSAQARFTDCQFVGSTSWSAWPNKPGLIFERCTFAGTLVHAFTGPSGATRFNQCRFTDDSSLSQTGRLYFGGPTSGAVVNLSESDEVLFDECRFELTRHGLLPWTWRALYRDCTMRQASRQTATPKGKYLGRTTIDAPVDLYGSMVVGTLIVNGRTIPRGPIGVPPW